MSHGKSPIRGWVATVPVACYFGVLLIVLGIYSNDGRGILVGMLLVVLAPVAVAYHRRR